MEKPSLFDWKISRLDKKCCSQQIEDFIIKNIVAGKLCQNDSLPSYRILAEINNISANSVKRAYSRLSNASWTKARVGAGTVISERASPRKEQGSASADIERLVYNPKLFPADEFSRYLCKHKRATEHLSKAELLLGYQARYLKEAVIGELNQYWGGHLNFRRLEIIKGKTTSFQAIVKNLCMGAQDILIHTSVRDKILDEILNKKEVKVTTLNTSAKNFLPLLEKKLKKYNVRAIYICPQSDLQGSRTLTPVESIKIIELAKKYKVFIIEEGGDHDLTKIYKPLAWYPHEGYVIYTMPLSKATDYMESLRVIVASAQFISKLGVIPVENRDVIQEKAIADLFFSGKMQEYRRRLLGFRKKISNL